MKVLALAAAGLVVMIATGLFGVTLAPLLAADATPAAGPSAAALADIPPDLLGVYTEAAESCGMPWSVLAAVGKVETDHGRSVAPGARSGTNGAGAAGPMQFLAETWAAYGVDADRDGLADVYSPVDAIWGAANYLCANGAAELARLDQALWHYNHNDAYVAKVRSIAAGYEQTAATHHVGVYALPLSAALLNTSMVAAPHHDYPAVDLPVAVGTPTFAVTDGVVLGAGDDGGNCGGTVFLRGDDGTDFLYCHASRVVVQPGRRVRAGELVLLTGGQPGAPGAGLSTGPHLHLAMTVGRVARCPQAVLVAWLDGHALDPSAAPAAGCTY